MPSRPYLYQAAVLAVISGDTFQVELDLGFDLYTKVTVRLAGYKAPIKGQPGFELAQMYLKAMLRTDTLLVQPLQREAAGVWSAEVTVNDGKSATDLMNEFAANLLIKQHQ